MRKFLFSYHLRELFSCHLREGGGPVNNNVDSRLRGNDIRGGGNYIRMYTLILLFLFFLGLTYGANAITKISIDSGNSDPIPIVMNTFQDNGSFGGGLRDKLFEITKNDLESTGIFEFAPLGLFLNQVRFDQAPNFSYWSNLNFTVFVNVNIEERGGSVAAKVKIWNNVLAKLAVEKELVVNSNNARKVAHKIADVIYEHLTGDRGYFNSRVAFVTESGPIKKRVKKISIADFDGYNIMHLTDGRFLTLTPRFSPKGDQLMYVSYENSAPRVYMQAVAKGARKKLVGEFAGMSFAPRFHPSGERAVMSIAGDGGTHLYEINFFNNKLKRLTWGDRVIHTSPTYSPDGTKMAYSSDETGSLQLYVMNLNTNQTKRISFGGGAYSSAAWSPRGDLIAFTKHMNNAFHIGVVRPDGEGERLLTSAWMDDSPTWSPNGRAIMFSRETSSSDPPTIYIVDLLGNALKKFDVKSDASDPCWDYAD